MAISVEAILSDARKLVLRLKEHDNSADCLITRMQSLQKQQDAMKQVQGKVISLHYDNFVYYVYLLGTYWIQIFEIWLVLDLAGYPPVYLARNG